MGRNGAVRDESESGRIRQDAEASPHEDDVALVAACPELKCLVPLFSVDTLAAAARRARRLSIGADRVLIACGLIAEEVYLHRFSMRSGIRLLDLKAVPPSALAMSDEDVRSAARTGQLALRIDGKNVLVFCLRDDRARIFMQTALASPRQIGHLRLVTELALQDVLIHRTRGIIRPAIEELRTRFPALSAAPPPRRWYAAMARRTAIGALLLGCLAIMTALPAMAGDALALIFLAGIGIRLTASLLRATSPIIRHFPDHDLPTYSIIVALYREERVVGQLLESLRALDYPAEKLDVILVLEADDDATHRAVADARPPSFVRTLVAPDEGPRTKPKALNVALPFARGRYVAIYDAEDRPDPDQLKRALAAFRAGEENLACVQARLAIENADDSLITRLFAAEYAAQFDIVMPGYDCLGLPWPLGGTSNHFDTAKLREAGAWDPFNVTEDADLGLRFARFRFQTGIIDSTTWEEAPITMRPWIKQRTRWMKGWMQTWWVHARRPVRYWRRTGWRGMVTRDLVIGGALLAALAYPVLILLGAVMGGEYLVTGEIGWTSRLVSPLHGLSIAAGLGVATLLKLRGLNHRDLLSQVWVLLLTPLYWGMLSFAAWRALFQLRKHPHVWEKTEHGAAGPRNRT